MTSMRRRALPAGVALAVLLAACQGGGTEPPDVRSYASPFSATTGGGAAPSGGTALSVLATLPVKGRAPKTGYDRAQFGQAWTDDNDSPGGHNGCDTRNDVLRRDLADDVVRTSGCVLLAGVLNDPYTATTITFRRGKRTSSAVQIDHVVALSNAWQTGAQQLSAQRRRDLANDPLELLAVDGPTNQAKGDGDAATWLPPNRAYRCSYVARQIAVKRAYRLWVTPAERDAMGRVLRTCPMQNVPRETGSTPTRTTVPPRPASTGPAVTSPSRSASSSSASAAAACTTTPSGNCIRGGQFCKQSDYGRAGTDADGTRYTCAGDRQRPRWDR